MQFLPEGHEASVILRTFLKALVAILMVSPLAAAEPTTFDTATGPLFKTYCLRCHDAQKQEGKFRLDTLPREFVDQAMAQRWGEVVFRINNGEMPPKDQPQPKADELGRVVEAITSRIKEGEAARMAKRGPVAHYRLSRDEYGNTISDLLGVQYDVTLPGAFNDDPRWHGFERIGALLSLSPSHVDRYFKAAEIVLARAFPEMPPTLVKRTANAIDIRHHGERKRLERLGITADKIRVPVWPSGSVAALRSWWFHQKDSGVYRARVKLSGLPGLDGTAPHLSVWHPTLKRSIFDEDILAPEDQPITIEFETFLSVPADLDFINEIPEIFSKVGNHTLNVLNSSESIFLSTRDMSQRNPTSYKLFDDDGRAIHPTLLIDSVEWEGPIVTEADLKKREGLMPKDEPERASVRLPGDSKEPGASALRLMESQECLKRLATRAWRRPVTDAEMGRFFRIVEGELAAGEKFRTAHLAAMTGILTSKNFYYLEEGSATERRDKVNDWELASRLSYFLWGSMPDDALFAAAASGKLHEPAMLREQFGRMLADPKIARFTRAFPHQWLQLHRVGMFPPDPKLYPNYDLWLEKSMALEPAAFFTEVFSKNLPIREFLASDWALVNPRLAQHYGLRPLTTSGFQRVVLKPEDHRGGLLTQAGVLMLTSDGTRHRPVHRGVLVSEAIFGRTPPPPPPNVEPLAPIPNNKPKVTIRQQLESHATHAICASCHAKIDPLGLAFDNYDAIGQWRTEEKVAVGQGANPPVVASGKLPDGRAFQSPDEFKTLLVQDLDRFAEAFTEQLATFALRRVMTIDDAAQIKAIAQASKAGEYRLRTLIENLVMSELFQKR